MDVLVERYQRRKYVNQEDAPLLYYIRQKSGNVRVMDVDTMATAIESKSSLTAGDVKHTIEAFVEQLRLSLTQGDKVKIDGLGTFHITLTSDGTETMKDCTVRSIRRVNVRFVADKALKLMNSSHTSTRSENNVNFVLSCSHIDSLYHLILIPKIIALLSLVAPSVVNLIVVAAVTPLIAY